MPRPMPYLKAYCIAYEISVLIDCPFKLKPLPKCRLLTSDRQTSSRWSPATNNRRANRAVEIRTPPRIHPDNTFAEIKFLRVSLPRTLLVLVPVDYCTSALDGPLRRKRMDTCTQRLYHRRPSHRITSKREHPHLPFGTVICWLNIDKYPETFSQFWKDLSQ